MFCWISIKLRSWIQHGMLHMFMRSKVTWGQVVRYAQSVLCDSFEKLEVQLEPNLHHRCIKGTFRQWGQGSHTKVKVHLRSSCKIGWNAKLVLHQPSKNTFSLVRWKHTQATQVFWGTFPRLVWYVDFIFTLLTSGICVHVHDKFDKTASVAFRFSIVFFCLLSQSDIFIQKRTNNILEKNIVTIACRTKLCPIKKSGWLWDNRNPNLLNLEQTWFWSRQLVNFCPLQSDTNFTIPILILFTFDVILSKPTQFHFWHRQ